MKPSSAKAKGSKLEREAASLIGGKRMPLSGAVGGGDIALPTSSIFNDWMWEAKARARLPAYFTQAMMQCALACRGSNKRPAIVLKEDRGRIMFACYLEDFVGWSEALAEVGQGQLIRSLVRDARRNLDAIDEAAK